MKLAHLILAHTDEEHIERLIKRLTKFSDVYIHLDKNKNIENLKARLHDIENCFFILQRFHCNWGGVNAIHAEMELIHQAMRNKNYDRLVFLQGADYPLKNDTHILDFFAKKKMSNF